MAHGSWQLLVVMSCVNLPPYLTPVSWLISLLNRVITS